MFVIETSKAKRLRKYSILMSAILALFGSIAGILTMHFYVKPSPARQEVRLFGFQLTRRGQLAG
jgi:hypothetical protein